MKKALWILALVALIAGFATTTLADEVEATLPTVETLDAEAVIPQEEELDEVSLEDILGISPFAEAEEKYLCFPVDACTVDAHCVEAGQPNNCGPGDPQVCSNPSGGFCTGTCVCC